METNEKVQNSKNTAVCNKDLNYDVYYNLLITYTNTVFGSEFAPFVQAMRVECKQL